MLMPKLPPLAGFQLIEIVYSKREREEILDFPNGDDVPNTARTVRIEGAIHSEKPHRVNWNSWLLSFYCSDL